MRGWLLLVARRQIEGIRLETWECWEGHGVMVERIIYTFVDIPLLEFEKSLPFHAKHSRIHGG